MSDKNYLLKFWAKTSQDAKKTNAFHPLICHLIDVAVVTQKIWEDVLPNATKQRIARAFGETNCDKETSKKVGLIVAFIAGLHDLGKCSPPFTLRGINDRNGKESLEKQILKHQEKDSDYLGRLRGKLQTIKFLKIYENTDFHIQGAVPKAMDAPHGYVTTIELPEILAKCFDFNPKIAEQIGVLIGGHHGVFPNSEWRKNGKNSVEPNLGNHHWADARIELAKTLADLLQIKPIPTNENSKLDNGTIMILAGLVSVADWIGSDTKFFDCGVEDFENIKLKHGSLENYLKHAETQASKALRQLGWTFEQSKNPQLEEKNLSNEKKFKKLFPFITDRRHLQDMAIEISEELKSPGIAVIESPMGEGKTEAAMFLAETWNLNLSQEGYYFALPTQATSNQMFGRVEKFLKGCFPNRNVHLQLTHGHASISAEFETLKKNFQNIQGVYEECSGDDCVPHVVAAEWFTYRKRGLLAPFGVGTVDQALMAVLQTKHVFVRLFGLAHKTVIIDEVHAYDAYMSTLLERLLEWLAALGSPVILLSATLPIERRNKLIEAYQRGLGVGTDEIQKAKYPRISYATDSTIKVRHINSSTKTQTLHIKKVDEILVKELGNSYKLNKEFAQKLKAKLKGGGCIAIICNTVKRSQEIYEQLSKDDFFADKIDLLHSRFRFCDRDLIEKRVLERFGKPDENGESPNRPNCSVLISTQIIEQSLDIDFDLMISDLAPIDLLLQRAGRLHRHDRMRKDEFKDATLWIIQPEINKDLPAFGVHKFVYDEHILLRTWLELNKKKYEKIEIPTEIEDLIKAVYDLEKVFENSDENLKNFWQTSLNKCLEDVEVEKEQAKYRYIKKPKFSQHISGIFAGKLEEDSPDVHQTLQAATRLTEPTATIICLWERGDKVFLDEKFTREIDLDRKPYLELTKELLRYSVGISNKSVVFKFFKEEVIKGWQESALLRHHRILKFDENRNCEKFGHLFRLDEKLGLQIMQVIKS